MAGIMALQVNRMELSPQMNLMDCFSSQKNWTVRERKTMRCSSSIVASVKFWMIPSLRLRITTVATTKSAQARL